MAAVVSVTLFEPSFKVLSSYFYVSLGFNGHFVMPNLAEFHDTAPLSRDFFGYSKQSEDL